MSENDATLLELCRQDRERYLCALSASPDKQSGLMALIAFNQELACIPHTVSEPMLGKIKLQWWIDVVPGILQGRPPSHPVAQALAQTRDVLLQRSVPLRTLAEARNFDLEPGKPTSLDALVAYARTTGGGLQVLMLDVLEIADENVRRAAEDVGTAWALIGLMRALPYPAIGRRDMLPHDTTVREVLGHAADLLQGARMRLSTHAVVKPALPALIIARLADRHWKRLGKQNGGPAACEEPPAGLGAVVSVWWGKLTGRF